MRSFTHFLHNSKYLALVFLIRIIRFLPYKFVLNLFRSLSLLAWLFDPFHRKAASIQMRAALGLNNPWRLVLDVFMNQAEILVDTVLYAYLRDEEIRNKVRVEGKEHLDEAMKSGRGLMMITGHIGNWEILSHIPRILGIQFCVMADQRKDLRLESIVDEIRSRCGATILPPKGKALMLIKELRRGKTIGMVVDNRGKVKDGLFCDLLGMPAPTNPAPAFIAIKGKALVLPVYAMKQGGTYHICFTKAVDASRFGDGDDAVRRLSQFMQSWVSSVVKEHPAQWFWLYSRWVRRSDMRRIIKKRLDFKEYVLRQARSDL